MGNSITDDVLRLLDKVVRCQKAQGEKLQRIQDRLTDLETVAPTEESLQILRKVEEEIQAIREAKEEEHHEQHEWPTAWEDPEDD